MGTDEGAQDDGAQDDALADAVAAMAAGDASPGSAARVAEAVARSARSAGAGAVASGRWLSEVVLDVAPRIPIRDLDTLQTHFGGLSGAALAGALIRSASRTSAAVGAVSGAAVTAQSVAPPAWLVVPFELLADTVVVAAIELKLLAELHEVYGRPIAGPPGSRGAALLRAWAERRGVRPADLLVEGGLARQLGRTSRDELLKVVRKRLVRRFGRNLSTLAPLLVGAVAGAEVNRRATRALGEAVVRDLAAAPAAPVVAPPTP